MISVARSCSISVANSVAQAGLLNVFTPTGEYVAVYNAFTEKPTTEIATKQQALVNTLVEKGIWAKLDIFYLLGAHTNANGEALVNWKTPGTHNATLVNAPAFEALYGFTSAGAGSYIRTNYNPSSQGVNYTQNSASGGVYSNTNVDGLMYEIGAANNASPFAWTLGMNLRQTNTWNNRINQTAGNLGTANTDSRGLFICSRTANNVVVIYKNGAPVTNGNNLATGILNKEIYLLCYNTDAGAAGFSTRQVRFAYMGGGLTAQQVSDFNTALTTFFFSMNLIADIDAIVGEETNIYPDSLTEVKIGESVTSLFTSDHISTIGLIKPLTESIKPLTLKIDTATQKLLLSSKIYAYNKAESGEVNILDVGDSLVYQGQKTRQQIIDTLDTLTVNFLGSQTDESGFKHEGQPGWQYAQMVSNLSPFWNGSAINPTNYFTSNGIPDIVHFRLGVNEAFGASISSTGFTLAELNTINGYIETLVNAFLAYNGTLKIIIGIPTVSENTGTGWNANYDESTYIQNYYIKAINELRSFIVSKYSNKRFNARVYLCAEGYTVDRNLGYPKDAGGHHSNGVHCNETGYRQLGKSLAATINAILKGK